RVCLHQRDADRCLRRVRKSLLLPLYCFFASLRLCERVGFSKVLRLRHAWLSVEVDWLAGFFSSCRSFLLPAKSGLGSGWVDPRVPLRSTRGYLLASASQT